MKDFFNENLFKFLVKESRFYIQNRNDIDDVVQNVVSNLWMHRSRLQAIENRQGYVKKIVKHECLDFIKSKKRHDSFAKTMLDDIQDSYTPKDCGEIMEELKSYTHDPLLQDLLNKRFLGHKYEEIAYILGQSEALLRKYFSTFCRQLQSEQKLTIYVNFNVKPKIIFLDEGADEFPENTILRRCFGHLSKKGLEVWHSKQDKFCNVIFLRFPDSFLVMPMVKQKQRLSYRG